ncbi:MAG: AtpZ/AtpI family protein [Gemmatimonadaceae bacterium]
MPGSKNGSGVPSASELAVLGVQFLAAILLCLFAGKWLDTQLGTSPWLLIAGTFVGAGAGFYAMYRKAFGTRPSRGPRA